MPNYKLPKELKNRMERELRQYYDNRKKLDRLKTMLAEEKPITKDPTGHKVSMFENTRSLVYLEERLHYVETVYMRLKPFEQEVYNLIFKEKYDSTSCKVMKNIDKSTYYNILNKSTYFLAEEWGEI